MQRIFGPRICLFFIILRNLIKIIGPISKTNNLDGDYFVPNLVFERFFELNLIRNKIKYIL